MKTKLKMFNVNFLRDERPHTWQRFATSAFSANTSAVEALQREYPDGDWRILSIERSHAQVK